MAENGLKMMAKPFLLAVAFACFVFTGKAQSGGGVAWLSVGNRHNLELLAGHIAQAPNLGLKEDDYQPAFIRSLINNTLVLSTAEDTADTEARINQLAIRLFSDIAYGRQLHPPVNYNGLSYDPVCYGNMSDSMAMYLAADRFSSFLSSLEPATSEYTGVKDRLAFFRRQLADSGFRDIPVTSFRVDTSNRPLLNRLIQLGFLDAGKADSITTRELQEKLGAAQRMFNLLPDGMLRSSVVKALNVPFTARLRELERALNQLRWLHCARQQFFTVVVNIPSGGLTLYQRGKATLFSRVVVGKRSNPTPMLCSRINEVVVYPYWTVPYKIATRELLPHIKRNISYLEVNQFDVLDQKGRIVDPAQVNWQSLHAGNFPYVLRQGTGCDNSLGIVKLNFNSPYSVYLHDTPWKSLFMLNQRFFSHGCIRVEEAVSLSRLLLEDAADDMDTLIAKGWKPGQKPVTMPLNSTAYVFVLYNTAWPDENGNVRFYTDEYGEYSSR